MIDFTDPRITGGTLFSNIECPQCKNMRKKRNSIEFSCAKGLKIGLSKNSHWEIGDDGEPHCYAFEKKMRKNT